jgi:predicted peptidase
VKAKMAEPPASGTAGAAAASSALTGPYASLATGDWALSEFKSLPFALHAPKNWSAAKPLPLVVALHGKSDNNENGKQVGDWMKGFADAKRQEKNPCVILAPLCYQPHGGTGGGWSDKPGDEVIALVKDLVKSLPVDKSRIYVTGHSMGGFGTCHLLASEPRLFAAGIPIAGCSGDAGALKRMPLWMFHAADDDVVKADGARSLAKALDRGKNFKYTEYADGGHGIAGRVFDDDAVHEWLFAQGGKK